MINIYTPINHLGFGTHGKNMIKAINKLNNEVCLTVVGQPDGSIMTSSYGPILTTAIQNKMTYSSKNPSVYIFHESHCNQFSGDNKYAFSIFETDKVNPLNIRMLQHSGLNGILVTTEYHKQILIKHGIESDKIHIIHEGIDPDIFNTSKSDDKLIDTGNFTFITVGKNEKRKNTDKIVKAFINTCAYKDMSLICHTFNPFIQSKHNSLEQFIPFDVTKFGFKPVEQKESYIKLSNGVASIYLTYGNIKDEDMYKLYNSANVGIQCSSGEAWDLPLQEMMACGVPTIASNCSGHSEYLKDFKCISDLVIEPISEELANDGIWFDGNQGNWSKISQSDIQDRIELVVNNKDKYINKFDELSKNMINKYSWTVAADKLLSIICT